MRSPIHALLWEIWRVTRVEVAWRLALGIVAGLAVLVVFAAVSAKDFGAVIAMILLVAPHYVGWVFLPRLNGGRPGFPLCLLYTRPVRTAVIVGLPMAYLTAVPAAIYLVSALLLRVASGYPFPLLPVAAWIAALNLVQTATNWSARNMVVLMLGNLVAGVSWIYFAVYRLTAGPSGSDWHDSPNLWPTIFDFPRTDYALIALIGLTSFGVAVGGVARQRHGDARAATPSTAYARFPEWLAPEWLVNLLRFPCPTSSATWAQVWFDLKPWLPLLTIILVVASVVNPVLLAVNVHLAFLRPVTLIWVMLSVMAVLPLGANAFGIRYRQGRLYGGAFDATRPAGTARLAGLTVIVRSACVLVALTALGVSLWASRSFIATGKVYKPLLPTAQDAIEGAIGALTGYQQVALAVVASIGVAVMVASLAALWALWARYSRRLNIGGLLLLLYGLALALLKLAEQSGIASESLVDALFGVTRWTAASAMALATVYLLWSGLAERLLTLHYVCGSLLVSLVFGAAWVSVLRAAGVQFGGLPTMDAVWMLSPALLPLMASVLAPWSLDRIRHI